jgi:hypothetical protein
MPQRAGTWRGRACCRRLRASVLSNEPATDTGSQRWLELGLIDKMLEADRLSDEAAEAAGLSSG